MSGETDVTVVTNSYAFLFCMRGCGRVGRPAFPAPSIGREINAQLGRNRAARMRNCIHVIARQKRWPVGSQWRLSWSN